MFYIDKFSMLYIIDGKMQCGFWKYSHNNGLQVSASAQSKMTRIWHLYKNTFKDSHEITTVHGLDLGTELFAFLDHLILI